MEFTRRVLASLSALCLVYAGSVWAKSPTTVRDSLAWLARHQLQDGSWRFDPPGGVERSYADPGTWKSAAGATSLALLPFFGASQTHKTKGPYRDQIRNGLNWLMVHQKPDGDLSAGGVPKELSHTLATIALCEAYGLSGDREVGVAAQKAIRLIVESRDTKLGSRSDSPGKPPTLFLLAWQIMAIRTAMMAGLEVPPALLETAGKILDSLQTADGKYGETIAREVSNAATAMGLLSRMYLAGRPRGLTVFGGHFLFFSSKESKEPADWVKSGQQFLSRTSLSSEDAIYNLFATVYIHELSGADWDAWNRKMRKQLVDSQIKEGNEAGSWWNADDVRAAEGGRLFQTAINTLMLEVYY